MGNSTEQTTWFLQFEEKKKQMEWELLENDIHETVGNHLTEYLILHNYCYFLDMRWLLKSYLVEICKIFLDKIIYL